MRMQIAFNVGYASSTDAGANNKCSTSRYC